MIWTSIKLALHHGLTSKKALHPQAHTPSNLETRGLSNQFKIMSVGVGQTPKCQLLREKQSNWTKDPNISNDPKRRRLRSLGQFRESSNIPN